eukprot:TRINITY_DN18326_c4_g1_i1.p1 TRINITY_DN18326_c4_g1~~TRINITY_DN18326_c4_g1_i1.p1  ORF type:complete len:204 (+),score=26.96 TRINITY_DN18326_c4_g1_i1:83-694(+)
MVDQDFELSRTRTDYQRIADAHALQGERPRFLFSGKHFTHSDTNRNFEIKRGCGISPRVWGDHDDRVAEEPVINRAALQYATMSISAQGGHTPRRRQVDDYVAQLRREATRWQQHDHEKSNSKKKELRHMVAAGRNSASLGYCRLHSCHRPPGVDDRPPWMREDEHLPGGWEFTPSDPTGDPTLFGKDSQFSMSFRVRPGDRR